MTTPSTFPPSGHTTGGPIHFPRGLQLSEPAVAEITREHADHCADVLTLYEKGVRSGIEKAKLEGELEADVRGPIAARLATTTAESMHGAIRATLEQLDRMVALQEAEVSRPLPSWLPRAKREAEVAKLQRSLDEMRAARAFVVETRGQVMTYLAGRGGDVEGAIATSDAVKLAHNPNTDPAHAPTPAAIEPHQRWPTNSTAT